MTGSVEEWLGIGDFAARTGVGVSTLRSWEERVGFPEPARSGGGTRRYRATDVARVARVRELRGTGLSLEEAVTAVRSSAAVGQDSLYAGLRRDHPGLEPMSLSARTLLALTWAMEDECLVRASHPLVIGCFQSRASYAASGHRWRELARSARAAMVLSDFEATEPDASPARVALPATSPLLNEWSLVCLDPESSVALVGWERPGAGAGGRRRFEVVLSVAPDVVSSAAARCLAIGREAGVGWAADEPSSTVSGSDSPTRAIALLQRFAGYADELARSG